MDSCHLAKAHEAKEGLVSTPAPQKETREEEETLAFKG